MTRVRRRPEHAGSCAFDFDGGADDGWDGGRPGGEGFAGVADWGAEVSDGAHRDGRERVSGDRTESGEAEPVGKAGARGTPGGAGQGCCFGKVCGSGRRWKGDGVLAIIASTWISSRSF